MAILPIVTGENLEVLRSKAAEVTTVNKDIKKLIKDMQDTVKAADGLGLAAPQVDVSIRLCLCLINKKMTPLINPEIIWNSEQTETMEEGCLSLPKINANVTRPSSIVVRYIDEKNNAQERKLVGMDAVVVQHEIDHLNGILIVDY